jgi:hypothetical protein
MKEVTVGKDMFLNDVFVGQHVLYTRAAPGGVGIGQIMQIDIISERPGYTPAGWKYGCNHFKNNKTYIWYRFRLKTQNGRYTTKFFDEIISNFDAAVYERIKDE